MWINRGYFGRLTSVLQDWLSLKAFNTPSTFDLMSNMQQWFNWHHRWTSNMFKDSDPRTPASSAQTETYGHGVAYENRTISQLGTKGHSLECSSERMATSLNPVL
jgi:hypothetical protein